MQGFCWKSFKWEHYNRFLRCHLLVAEALERMLLELFFVKETFEEESLKPSFESLVDDITFENYESFSQQADFQSFFSQLYGF